MILQKKKSVKISKTKHHQHLKHKKNYTKPLRKKIENAKGNGLYVPNATIKHGKQKSHKTSKLQNENKHKCERNGDSLYDNDCNTMDEDMIEDIMNNVIDDN